MPKGLSGVASNKNEPSIALWEDRRGLRQQGRIMLRVMSLCGVSRHQLAISNNNGKSAMPVVK